MDSASSFSSYSSKNGSIDIILSPDVIGYRETISQSDEKSRPQRNLSSQSHQDTMAPDIRPKKNAPEHHVTFQEPPEMRQQASIHPAFRKRRISGRAGKVTAIDHQIARSGGTTSSYKKLPHRLQISKQNKPPTFEERVIELTRINGHLRQELAYYKDNRAAEMKFHEKILKLRTELEDTLKERSQSRAKAEFSLLTYWGIDIGDGNLEDIAF
jgi:hypothetical protein